MDNQGRKNAVSKIAAQMGRKRLVEKKEERKFNEHSDK
jgi:hypothetical protein